MGKKLFSEYAYLSEHTDLRNVMGMGIAITRGSAAAMSLCYSLLLLSMARNLLTKLKETPLYQYIPIDSYLQFHKVNHCSFQLIIFYYTSHRYYTSALKSTQKIPYIVTSSNNPMMSTIKWLLSQLPNHAHLCCLFRGTN